MKNVVTFETALRLKDAGFPQPKPEFGQIWYALSDADERILEGIGEAVVILNAHDIEGGFNAIGFGGMVFYPGDLELENMAFAPTATDVLSELAKIVHPNIIRIDASSYDSDTPNVVRPAKYLIYSMPQGGIIGNEFNDNLAEAAAIAYLEIHEKK